MINNREYEVKILDVHLADTSELLIKSGAEKVSEHNYSRVIYDLNGITLPFYNQNPNSHAWLRLRTDGITSAITLKQRIDDSIGGTTEYEVIVNSFDNTRSLLKALGLKEKKYQENYRILFRLDDLFISLDFWPKIPPYMEIEANSEETLISGLRLLGISEQCICTFSGRELYEHYGFMFNEMKVLCLDESDWVQIKRAFEYL